MLTLTYYTISHCFILPVEASHAAELHIKEGQLEITTDDGVAVVPIEDLNQI
jgi:hypothetical protein